MKVTIELDDNIQWAIAKTYAEKCALAWFDGVDSGIKLEKHAIKTLYEYAFHDGMECLFDLMEQSKKNDLLTL